eukprot:gene10778-7667_t
MIRYDSRNTVLDYARSNERPWKRSLDKFVRDHVLSTKPAAISGADSPLATASREQKLDPEQSVDADVAEAAMTPHLSLTIALDDARSILSQCQHVVREKKRYVVETLSTPTAAAVEDVDEVAVPSAAVVAAPTAVSSSEQSETKVDATGAGDVPFPPSYFSNARSRWAKDMYHDMWRSYRQLVFGDSGFRLPPVVPLHLLRQSAPNSLFAPGFF